MSLSCIYEQHWPPKKFKLWHKLGFHGCCTCDFIYLYRKVSHLSEPRKNAGSGIFFLGSGAWSCVHIVAFGCYWCYFQLSRYVELSIQTGERSLTHMKVSVRDEFTLYIYVMMFLLLSSLMMYSEFAFMHTIWYYSFNTNPHIVCWSQLVGTFNGHI